MTGSCNPAVLVQNADLNPKEGEGAAPSIILLGTDTPIGLAVMRDLGRHGYPVIGIGRNELALGEASRHCTAHFVRAADDSSLIAQIERIAASFAVVYLIAISEADLLFVNRNRSSLERYLKPLVPPAEMLAKVLDKMTCQKIAEQVGIRSPATWQFESLAEAEAAAESLNYPAILKWSDPNVVSAAIAAKGLQMHKALYAASSGELLDHLRQYWVLGHLPMVQEYCAGKGIGHMFLALDGETLIEFQHERLHEWPPEGGVSSLCQSVPLQDHEEAREKSRALLRLLRWTGVAMIEYRYDTQTGDWRFLEVNGRFWGSLPLAVSVGIPFAAGLVAATGEGTRIPPYNRNYPRRCSMFWIPETKRLFRILFEPSAIADPYFSVRPLREIAAYLWYLFNPFTRFYVFSWRDPMPFFRDIGNVIRKLGRLVPYRSSGR